MVGQYYLLNQKLVEVEQYESFESDALVVYEVIRVIDGVPLFFLAHFDRLIQSCCLVGEKVEMNSDLLCEQLFLLGKKNGIKNGNVRVRLEFKSGRCMSAIYFIAHHYPSETDYLCGVHVGFLEAERQRPEAKVEQASVRDRANSVMTEKGLSEVLLVDRDHKLSEGSRSNLFLIKNNTLYTAPLGRVLSGVTLLKVLSIADRLGVEVCFESILKSDIDGFDALFLTGTSINILPIANVGSFEFDVNHLLLSSFKNEYEQMITEDIKNRKALL